MAKGLSRHGPGSGLAAILLGLIVLGLPTWRPVGPWRGPAFAQYNSSSQLKDPGDLVVVATDLANKTIQFGDKLDVLVTLQNQGKDPITIPAGALLLESKGWTGFPGGGSGLGESVLNPVGDQRTEAITLHQGWSSLRSLSDLCVSAGL